MRRMGASAHVASDQRPFGRSVAEIVQVDEAGHVVGYSEVEDPADALVLDVEQFVDLSDGRPDFVAFVRESGVAVTEEALAALPFVVEIGDDVLERITR